MFLGAAIWRTYTELDTDFVEWVESIDDFNFDTIVVGGFGSASFSVGVSGWSASRWYRDYVGYHVVIFDFFGRRVYEGRVQATDGSLGKVSVSLAGYYVHAGDLTHGIEYPASVPTSISDIIIDTVTLADQWSTDLTHIDLTVTDITPQDFRGETKLQDAIDATIKFGSDGILPVPLHFGIWENRVAYLTPYKEPTGEPEWLIYTTDFVDSGSFSIARSRDNLFNKLQVLYDDPDIGQDFTGWFEDLVSQSLFGVREGSLNIGAAEPGLANIIGALALRSYAYPTQESKIEVSGRVYAWAGAADYPYMVRAGDLVMIPDYDPSVAQSVAGQAGQDFAIAVVTRTSYSANDNKLSIEFGKANPTLDLLLARLGMSSGSVR